MALSNNTGDRVKASIGLNSDGLAAQRVMGQDVDVEITSVDRKSTRLNSSHIPLSRMPSSA